MPRDSTYMRYLKISRPMGPTGTESGVAIARVWAGGKWGVAVQ